MPFWATGACESVALWTPPGAVYVAKDDEPELDVLLHDLVELRVADLYALFDQFGEHLPAGDHTLSGGPPTVIMQGAASLGIVAREPGQDRLSACLPILNLRNR